MSLWPPGTMGWPIGAAAAAFTVSLGVAYWNWQRKGSVRSGGEEADPVALARAAGFPLVLGVLTGLGVLFFGLDKFAAGDRFYSVASLRALTLALGLGLLCLLGAIVLSPVRDLRAAARATPVLWALRRLLELGAVLLVVAAGVRFTVLGWGGLADNDLGTWGAPVTVLWLLIAIWAVRLLDGLDGAAPVLLLTAAVAVFVGASGTSEYFLKALAVVIAAAVVGSLRFHFFPARLPLRGPSASAYGFLFALLTVLARQKTVAALLLIFPLAVVLLLVGGAMLGFLERTLLLQQEPPDSNPEGNPGERRKHESAE